ncbi:FLICE-associated huge protein isoform X2 [Nomia melanderi]|uniref:FLICE-associated huge protein isoform X2 n=1 Tax=Nomia melanderi TaxID=2448451 RepID=UPI003FCE6EB5
MEDDIDIYEDLPSFGEKLEENFVVNHSEHNTTPECAELKRQIANLTVKLEDFRKVNENLELNLVSLLKTAKAEIARKDKMIDSLRKELDDVTFRRGGHFKKNDRVCTSSFSNTVATVHRKTVQASSSAREDKHGSLEIHLSYNLTKHSNLSKSTSTPSTVFSERLRKRIADEQNLERREKQSSRFTEKSKVPTTEGYITESDKENGSLANTDSSTDQEKRDQGNSVANIPQKRANDETYRSGCLKRFKSEEKEHTSRSNNKEICENVVQLSDIESERRRTTHFDSEQTRCTLAQEEKRHSYLPFVESAGKTGQRDTGERTSKRNCKSVVSTIAPEEKHASHGYRPSIAEHRRIKRREDCRANETREDRRSRGRQPSCENYREEKYIRSKYKYAGCEEKSERRHDGRSSTGGTVKSTTVRKESRNSQNAAEQPTSEQNSTCNAQLLDHCDDYGCRVKDRPRSSDKTTRRDNRRDECNEYSSHRKSVRKKFPEHGRQSEASKSEKLVETNESVERIDRRKLTENGKAPVTKLLLDDSSEKLIDRKKDLECSKIDVDQVTNEPTSNTDDCSTSKEKSCENAGDKAKESTHCSTATDASAACLATVASLDEQSSELVENVENNETIENVENIEKFIRNYTSDNDPRKKNLDERDAASNDYVNEYKSIKNDVIEDETILEDQQRDAVRRDGTEREADAKLRAIESGVMFQQLLEDSDRTGQTETAETTTAVTESAKNVNDLAVDGNCAAQRSVSALESNYSNDFAANGRSASFGTGTISVSSDSSATDNIPPSIPFQFPEENHNDNGGDKDKVKSNDESCFTSVLKDSDADKVNGNSTYDIHYIDKDEDEDKDNDNIGVRRDDIENNCPNVTKKDQTNERENSENLSAKLNEQVENEKEKALDKSTTEKGLHESNKSAVNNGTNAKAASMNVHGKIVVFARRKKPVCLANNNANMTVLINNCHSPNTN